MQLSKQDLTYLFVKPGQNWSKKTINAALEQKGATFASVAKELGVSEGTLRNVLYRSIPSYEEAIAQKIGVTPEVIWPNRPQADNRMTA